MVTRANEQVSLADAKAHLSEVIEGIETEHRRVVITKHGRPSVVVLAVEDLEDLEALEALEDTLDLLSDPNAMAGLREAAVVAACRPRPGPSRNNFSTGRRRRRRVLLRASDRQTSPNRVSDRTRTRRLVRSASRGVPRRLLDRRRRVHRLRRSSRPSKRRLPRQMSGPRALTVRIAT